MSRRSGQGRARSRAAPRQARSRPRVAVMITAPEWSRRLRAAKTVAGRAAQAALIAARTRGAVELAVVLADNRTVRRLNRAWRGKDRPTNVLSFAADGAAPRGAPKGMPRLLGDVVIAGGVTAAEARTQGKSLAAHLTHLVVHGVLHLLGHDHERAAEARRMEALEVRILRGLGVADPYRSAS